MISTIATVFLGLCCGLAFAAKGDEEFRWKRTFPGNDTPLAESAIFNSRKKYMLMNSEDDTLLDMGFRKSQSMHDFKTGRVAVKITDDKNEDWCFIMDTAKSIKEVQTEIRRRAENNMVVTDETAVRQNRATCGKENKEGLKRNSKLFPRFCKDAMKRDHVYSLQEYTPGVDKQLNVFPIPIPIWCFWWPYPIWITIDIDININFG